jgi:hypothetical protein
MKDRSQHIEEFETELRSRGASFYVGDEFDDPFLRTCSSRRSAARAAPSVPAARFSVRPCESTSRVILRTR